LSSGAVGNATGASVESEAVVVVVVFDVVVGESVLSSEPQAVIVRAAAIATAATVIF
jgi:hypothetical protein